MNSRSKLKRFLSAMIICFNKNFVYFGNQKLKKIMSKNLSELSL
jgi:hypothetical protein